MAQMRRREGLQYGRDQIRREMLSRVHRADVFFLFVVLLTSSSFSAVASSLRLPLSLPPTTTPNLPTVSVTHFFLAPSTPSPLQLAMVVLNPGPLFLCFSVRGLEQIAIGSPLAVVSLLAVCLSVKAIGIALSERKARYSYASLWVLLSSLAFVVVCILAFRPMVLWMIHKTPEEQPFSETQICIVPTGVMISAFITNALRTHAVFGVFVYGLVIPNGPLAAAIIEKLEDFVCGLLLPLFFAINGLKTNLTLIKEPLDGDL
ncbi:cation/H(+) antiporter 17-like [Arachis stenosperma]|uniref:cation/H(+) antiporter 17-like n=1 Tax=Arachis stenosperma TaxID=217475 RepID=UPI0025AC82EE|nr:cation/H(+) antiporter 17-like [Arachis stenosperma]